MSLPGFFIRRPVFAAVLSLLIIVIGLVSLTRLPVRELPDVDAATVTISTNWRGAAPSVVDTQITEVIESAVAGVAGVDRIESSSERGDSRIVVTFVTSRDVDAAANDIRGAVGRVISRLPEESEEPRIYKNDSDADPVMRLSIVSDRHTPPQITDYAERYIIDRLATLEGVSAVTIWGNRRYAMRIALDPSAMAARRLTATEIATALRTNNVELPAGEVVSLWRQFQVRAATRLETPDEFRELVVAMVEGAPVRLGEVATVFVGSENDETLVRSEGRNAIGLGVARQSQANTIAISQAVRGELERIQATLPPGMEIFVSSDDAVFIQSSIEEVLTTLAIAVGLVVLVIFFFLGSPLATLAPAVVIPVALIGAVAGIYAFGFSINILTLFALILAIGIVVDDAIVVLENIQRRVERGEPPAAAALRGADQVVFAVIATSITLISVFIPISFLDGQVGRLFTEFGIVMAVAVAFSTLVALTLTPVLCHRVLRRGSGGMLERAVNWLLGRTEAVYRAALRAVLGFPLVVVALALVIAGSAGWLSGQVARELSPREDRGVFFVSVTAPQGSTVAYTDREVREVEERLQPLLESGEATRIFSIVGFRGETHRAFVVVRLSDWKSGRRASQDIVSSLIPQMTSIPGARAFPIQPSGLGLRGSRTPLQVKVLGPDFLSVQEWSVTLLEAMQGIEGLENLETDYEETQPELRIEVDRALADDLGISIEDIGATLQTFFAGREVTGWIERGREYPVILQAREDVRRTAEDLGSMYVRSGSTGALVPISALVRSSEGSASPELARFNRLPAIEISGSLADGMDLGAAIDAVQAAAAQVLPPEAQIAFDGQSREFQETSGGAVWTFVFAVLVVYLVLAAQFESFVDPFVILMTVPLGLTGALATLWLTGQSLNIYTQVGLVLLVGLMAKNGILIVEFANQLRDEGYSVREAALEGAVARLRPVMMTVISTLLGALPLVVSTGAGAEARAAIGWVIIGGFGAASVLTLFLTPVLYDLLVRFTRPRTAVAKELEQALAQDPRTPAE
ncbi:efflux RND transporter permease subunit [uncultured Albimonas sp.]|uniref:efflux RND transporter permease subunit n=1 Tax=uncultured Albimonas sp. TaxID=1331701 RepID=UPI0030ED337A